MTQEEVKSKITMDYKEKYEMALERARKNYETAQKLSDSSRLTIDCFMDTLTSIFPELQDTEDEKWIKWLINHLKGYINQTNERYGEVCKEAIAWLEKQGEQKTVISDLASII